MKWESILGFTVKLLPERVSLLGRENFPKWKGRCIGYYGNGKCVEANFCHVHWIWNSWRWKSPRNISNDFDFNIPEIKYQRCNSYKDKLRRYRKTIQFFFISKINVWYVKRFKSRASGIHGPPAFWTYLIWAIFPEYKIGMEIIEIINDDHVIIPPKIDLQMSTKV